MKPLFSITVVVAGLLNAAIWSAAPAVAQERATATDIRGVVLAEPRTPVSGATVIAVNQDTGLTRRAESGPSGRFQLPAMPVGSYNIAVEHAGFWPVTLQGLVVSLGPPLQLEVALLATTIVEHVSVVAADTVVRLEPTDASSLIRQQQIDALPTNGRNFVAFSLLAPGVTTDRTPQQGASRTSGLSFAGQRARSNNIMVDGLDNNDETVGSVRAFFSQEAIREFEVNSGAPSAEFGKASGGIVNVVTRSGTNTATGDAFIFARDRALNARNYFERFTPAGQALDDPKAPFRQQQYGATIGGPVKRDSTFFFLSVERLDSTASNFVTIDDRTLILHPLNPSLVLGTPATILRAAGFPVDTGHVPYDVTLNHLMAKIDRHGAAHSSAFRFSTATELNENIEPFGGLVARSRGAALRATDVIAAASDVAVLSPRTVNDLRGQIARRDQSVRSLDPRCGGPCVAEADGGPTLEVTGVASVGRQRFTPTLRDNTRYQIVDSLSHSRGDHDLRAGTDISYLHGRQQTLPLHFGGRYIFQDISLPLVPGLAPVPLTAIQEVALGLPLAYVQGYGNSGAGSNFLDLALFAQDTWRVGRSATINAGLRYQRQLWPAATYRPAGYPGAYQFPADGNNIAPRISVAWRPANGGSLTVHGGYGVYYDNTITSVFQITKYINGAPDGLRTMVLRAPASFAAWSAASHRLTEPAALQLSGGGYPSLAITIDPALKTPYAHHAVAGVEQQLGGSITVAASALYVRGKHQLGTIDYNPIVPLLGPGRRPADVNGIAGSSASVLQYTSFGETWYRAVLMSMRTREKHGLTLLASYTMSKAEDTSTDFQSAFLPQDNGHGRDPRNPNGLPLEFQPRDERGPAIEDQRHRLVVSGSQMLPGAAQISAILTIGSGRPYNILAGSDLNGDGDGGSAASDRPRGNPSDPASSVGRNEGRLPGEASLDVRIGKQIRATKRVVIEPLLDVFNVLNRTNYTGIQNVFGPGAYPSNPLPTYGEFTTAAAGRQAQVALKVGF